MSTGVMQFKLRIFITLFVALSFASLAHAEAKSKHPKLREKLRQCEQMQSAIEIYQTEAAMRELEGGGGSSDSTCVNVALCCQKGSKMCYAYAGCGEVVNCTTCKC
ncbi:MAG: hypothetical protein K1X83_14115 [Oligoflexia bacterium]|nr:hypothetical protein [Oligoflexia bacterium]